MDEKNVQLILTELLYCALNGIGSDSALNEKLTPDVLPSVYQLAKGHSLAHLVSRYLFESGVVPAPALEAKLQKQEMLAIYNLERLRYTYGEVSAAFEEARIAYLPLKGSVIRPYYPDEGMRTSCDIDILVHEEDLDAAIRALEAKGYRTGEREYHDVSLYSPNGTHLELHFNIQENMEQLDRVLRRAWDYAEPTEGYRYAFKREFFVFHMYAHMAYHLMAGGCGIRSLMDLWVIEHRMQVPHDCARELLEEAGIYRFAGEVNKLANDCFTERRGDDPLLDYIWRGGVYGTQENQLAVKKQQSGSIVGYVIRRIFLPYRDMTILYPSLKKAPILLPLCWVRRWFRVIFGGKSGQLATEISTLSGVSEKELCEVARIRERLGL